MAYTEQDRRNHIRELQQYLYSLSFLDETLPRVIPDGIYGRQTALAVRAFQQKNGLRPNGETNRATWDAIVNAYRQQIQREQHRCIFIHQSGNCWGLEKQDCWCWCCKAS